MAARTDRVTAWALAALLAAGCSSPPTAPATPAVPPAVEVPATPVAPVAMEAAAPASGTSQHAEPAAPATAAISPATPPGTGEQATHGQVDAATLPEDVREYIVKQRMCRHLKAKADSGEGSPQVAAMICATANDAAWKALIRKYEGSDTVGSVLLAERPLDSAEPVQP